MNIYQDNQSCFQPFFMPESHCDTNPKLFDAQEAIMLGNLFKELYMSYRGFSNYCLQPQNKRQQALLEVQTYEFVAHEINLYLDIHPKNQRMVHFIENMLIKPKQPKKILKKNLDLY